MWPAKTQNSLSISVFAVHLRTTSLSTLCTWVLSYLLSAQRRLWSDSLGGCPGWSESSLVSAQMNWNSYMHQTISYEKSVCDLSEQKRTKGYQVKEFACALLLIGGVYSAYAQLRHNRVLRSSIQELPYERRQERNLSITVSVWVFRYVRIRSTLSDANYSGKSYQTSKQFSIVACFKLLLTNYLANWSSITKPDGSLETNMLSSCRKCIWQMKCTATGAYMHISHSIGISGKNTPLASLLLTVYDLVNLS